MRAGHVVIKTLLIPGFHYRLCWLRAVVLRKYLNANSQERASIGCQVAGGGRSVRACDKHRAACFSDFFVRSGYKRNKTVFCCSTGCSKMVDPILNTHISETT